MQDVYDYAVIGNDPGAVLSGIWMAHCGYQVLWLQEESAMRHQDHFPPTRAWSESSSLLEEWLTRAGLELKPGALPSISIEPQVLTSKARLRWSQNTKAFESHLKEETDDDCSLELQKWRHWLEKTFNAEEKNWRLLPTTAYERSLKKMTALGLQSWIKRDHGKVFWKLPKQARLHQSQSQLLASGWVSQSMRALGWSQSCYWVPGGRDWLLTELKTLATQLGVHVSAEPLIAVHAPRGTLDSLHFGDRVAKVKRACLGLPLEQVRGRVVDGKLKSPFKTLGWRYTLELSVHREAIPPGFTESMVWIEDQGPSLSIQSDLRADPVKIEMSTVLPFTDESLQPARLKHVASRMFRKLNELVPYLEFHLIKLAPDFREMKDFVDVMELYPYKKCEEIPQSLRVDAGQSIGIESGVKNLFVANESSHRDLGFYGSWIAGIQVHVSLMMRSTPDRKQAFQTLWGLS